METPIGTPDSRDNTREYIKIVNFQMRVQELIIRELH